MNPAVILPYRADTGDRSRNYRAVLDFWETFGCPINTADSSDPARFDKAEAVNTAVRDAAAADVLIITDVDILPTSLGQVIDAANQAYDRNAYVTTYTDLLTLNPAATRTVCDNLPDDTPVPRSGLLDSHHNTWLCSFAISRSLFDRAGGFDERFKGYGEQDIAFLFAAGTFGGRGHAAGTAYHLWHPFVDKDHPLRQANHELLSRYRAANGHPDLMQALTGEPR